VHESQSLERSNYELEPISSVSPPAFLKDNLNGRPRQPRPPASHLNIYSKETNILEATGCKVATNFVSRLDVHHHKPSPSRSQSLAGVAAKHPYPQAPVPQQPVQQLNVGTQSKSRKRVKKKNREGAKSNILMPNRPLRRFNDIKLHPDYPQEMKPSNYLTILNHQKKKKQAN